MAYYIRQLPFIPKFCPDFDFVGDEKFRADCFLEGTRFTEETDPPLHSIPTQAILRSRHKQLPDIFQLYEAQAVSVRFKEIVEALEPGVHQFFPIELLRNKKERFEEDYFIFNICWKIDAIIPEKSSLTKNYLKDGSERFFYDYESSDNDYRTLKKEIILGKHVWRDVLYHRSIYCSNEFHERFMRMRITGVGHFHNAYEE